MCLMLCQRHTDKHPRILTLEKLSGAEKTQRTISLFLLLILLANTINIAKWIEGKYMSHLYQ